MTSSAKLLELSAKLQSGISQLHQYVEENSVQWTSFDLDSALTVSLPPSLQKIREKAIEATEELHTLLLGPLACFTQLVDPKVCIGT